jgi:hypothetical protein
VGFFALDTWVLAVGLAGILLGVTVAGLLLGRRLGAHSEHLREPLGVLQGALVGFMGLVLAFGLSLAVGRYEARRADVVAEANAIGTTYLRAQTLAEPVRTDSLVLLRGYTAVSIAISDTVPGSAEHERAIAESESYQDRLWNLAGQALNEMFDAQADRVYGLSNRVPTAVLVLEVVGAAVALSALALHLATFGRGVSTVLIASLLVTVLLTVTLDLDRPTRGLIRVPPTPLVDVSTSMDSAPAASAPGGP